MWDSENTVFDVVVNHEEQQSIWSVSKKVLAEWSKPGTSGNKQECLAYIDSAWTNLRPLSLRRQMAEASGVWRPASAEARHH